MANVHAWIVVSARMLGIFGEYRWIKNMQTELEAAGYSGV